VRERLRLIAPVRGGFTTSWSRWNKNWWSGQSVSPATRGFQTWNKCCLATPFIKTLCFTVLGNEMTCILLYHLVPQNSETTFE